MRAPIIISRATIMQPHAHNAGKLKTNAPDSRGLCVLAEIGVAACGPE